MSSKELIILRGLPGSGKTTVAKQIVDGARDAIICSADSYFMEDGKYVFRQEELKQAHNACQMSVMRAMANGIAVVVVDNTNIKRDDMRPYVEMALNHGYEVSIRTIGGMTPKDIETYLKRQVHGVPQEKVEKMAHEYED